MKNRKIFVLGSLNMDLVIKTNKMPQRGETVTGKNFMINPGGKGANQAVACGKLGAEVTMIGAVGNDSFGQALQESLTKYNVDISGVLTSKNEPTGTAIVIVENNDNRIIINAGANFDQNVESIRTFIREHAQKDDILISQLEIPASVIHATFKLAKDLGMYVILNPAPMVKFPPEIYKYTDIIIPNETETKSLCGISPNSRRNMAKIRKFFSELNVREVLITLGEQGSCYLSDKGIEYFAACKTNVVDTTAAGDTFIGAFATRIACGDNTTDAIHFASRAAAITVSRMGAQQAIPTLDELMNDNH